MRDEGAAESREMMMITDFVPPQPAALPVSPKSVIATKKMKFLI